MKAIFISIFLLLVLFYPVSAQFGCIRTNYIEPRFSLSYSAGLPYFNKSLTVNGFEEHYEPVFFSSWGAELSLPLSRKSSFLLGINASALSYQHRLEGQFASSGQFGSINCYYKVHYLSIPLSLQFRVGKTSFFRLGYTGSFLGHTEENTLASGGAGPADQQAFLIPHSGFRPFQSSVSCGLKESFNLIGDTYLSFEPFLNYSFDPTAHPNPRLLFRPLVPGITLRLEFDLGDIDIDFDPGEYIRERRERKREELRKKKEQLEKDAREHIHS